VVVCKVCGTENEQGAAFCGSCGSFLEWNGETVASDDAPTAVVPVVRGPATPSPAAPPPTSAAAAPQSASSTGASPGAGGEPGSTGAIICPVCGTANEPSRVFCRSCATELAPTAAEPASAVVPPGRSGPPLALLGGAAAVVVLGVLAVVFLLPRSTPAGTATEAPSSGQTTPASAPPASGPDASGGVGNLESASPSPGGTGAPATAAPSVSAPPPSEPPTPTGRIVFAATSGGNADIWIWDASDGSRHKLVGGSGDQSDPSWAWDGSKVVYLTANGLRMIHDDGSAVKVPDFTHHGVDRHPAWSPNGKLVAFASTRQSPNSLDIFTRPVANNKLLNRLTNNPADDWDPNWSPDGSTIVFVSTRKGDAQLYLMDSDGTHERRLDLGAGIYDDPAFSPDGQWLAFTRRDTPTSHKALYVVHPDGSDMRRLTSVDVDESDPTWSPDSQLIAVVRGGKGSSIVIVDAATGADVLKLGVDDATNRQPDWR
jgi:Tol biopolymer transport system component